MEYDIPTVDYQPNTKQNCYHLTYQDIKGNTHYLKIYEEFHLEISEARIQKTLRKHAQKCTGCTKEKYQ